MIEIIFEYIFSYFLIKQSNFNAGIIMSIIFLHTCLYNPLKKPYSQFKYHRKLKNLIPEKVNSGMRLI